MGIEASVLRLEGVFLLCLALQAKVSLLVFADAHNFYVLHLIRRKFLVGAVRNAYCLLADGVVFLLLW